jgi:hypothetical protein
MTWFNYCLWWPLLDGFDIRLLNLVMTLCIRFLDLLDISSTSITLKGRREGEGAGSIIF